MTLRPGSGPGPTSSKAPAARNFERWPILGQTINTEPFSGKTYEDEILYLQSWLSSWLEWVAAQFLPSPVAKPTAPIVDPGTALTLTSTLGKTYYTLDGSDPRLPGARLSRCDFSSTRTR